MHALGSWCERYRSGTGARQSDRSSLWIKTRSALRLYFARSAPRSLHAPLRSHALVLTLDELSQIDGWQLLHVLQPGLIMNYSRNMLIKHILKLINYHHVSK